ncbi:MAG: hypothetical protein HYV32_01330 [Candidatus Kerfeldbacteria bacterium]|nr:hypothetical protein [Candidatus Kerfeldbacteria bacterium]
MPEHPFNTLKHYWRQYPLLGTATVCCLSALAYAWWIAAPTFTDPDSFYHIQMTQLIMKHHRAVTNFVWLPYTTLAHSYVDHHFLYHIFLIPFFLVFNAVLGMKIATVVLAASTSVLFYLVLRSLNVRYSFLFTLLLITTEGFSFRIGLSKAPSFSFLFMMAGAYAIIHYKPKLIAILSFFFVWSYGGFLLMLILTGVHASVGFLRAYLRGVPLTRQEKKERLVMVTGAFSGTLMGLLIHPSFPQHLRFYWEQIIQIGLVNYRGVIGVGGEWYPANVPNLIGEHTIFFLVLIISMIAFGFTAGKQRAYSWTIGGMFFFFFVFTLKSQRYIEYAMPWGYLFSACALQESGWLNHVHHVVQRALYRSTAHVFTLSAALLLIAYGLFIIPGMMIDTSLNLEHDLHRGRSVDEFAAVGKWLRDHSTTGDIVFHSDWDEFPALFYQVPKDRFIAGLDPTFFYREHPADNDLYWEWVNITTGKQSDQLLETLQQHFHARFVFIADGHNSMRANFIRDGRFRKVYEDDEATIFRVPRRAQDVEQSQTADDTPITPVSPVPESNPAL